MKKYENNPFTLSFGNKPLEYVSREIDKDEIIQKLTAEPPMSHCFIITGVRGSGKTVMLGSITKHFANENNWIVIDLNPEDDMREALAAKLYTSSKIKHLFIEKNFNFSFKGLTFSINGKNPILNIDDLLNKMFKEISKQNIKVLITIDEASNNKYMKQLALSFQMLIREDYQLFILATSLFENISSLENENNMTFLIRAPKFYLYPLSMTAIATSYKSTLSLNDKEALEAAKMTKGYAFAFQLLGYLLYESKNKKINNELINNYDQYLDEFAYTKIWSGLTIVEQKILASIKTNNYVTVGSILKELNITKEYFSRYRDRLIKKGLIDGSTHGKIIFTLPRFYEFIQNKLMFLDF